MLQEFFMLGVMYLAAIITPGPSTSLIIRNGLIFSRPLSLFSSFGIMCGIALQSATVLIGLTTLSEHSITFNLLKIICSVYLIYLGLRGLVGYNLFKKQVGANKGTVFFFLEGFLLEILNPIALCFFISIFTSIIATSHSIQTKILFWMEIVILGSMWFCGLATLSSLKVLSKKLEKFKRQIEVITSLIFILFGIKIFEGSFASVEHIYQTLRYLRF